MQIYLLYPHLNSQQWLGFGPTPPIPHPITIQNGSTHTFKLKYEFQQNRPKKKEIQTPKELHRSPIINEVTGRLQSCMPIKQKVVIKLKPRKTRVNTNK